MTQVEQMKMVLLYALDELDGGGKRHQVLQHINDNHYWYRNDGNDATGTYRPSETRWRNNFSYERQHLVADGYMRSGGDGNWFITESGRTYLQQLLQQARDMPQEEQRLFTLSFYQKFSSAMQEAAVSNGADEEAHYLAQLAAAEANVIPALASLSNEPRRKPAPRSTQAQSRYPRDPAVAGRALDRAAHLCEVDPSHPSFLRRNRPFLYMEPHHLIPISFTDYFSVELDREQNIFSLCSNCHNQIHYGRKEDVRALIARLFSARAEELCGILGREISLEEIFQIYGVF